MQPWTEFVDVIYLILFNLSVSFGGAEEFDTLITGHIREGNYRAVANFLELGALAAAAHPTYDHFLPLLYVLGAQEDGESVSTFNESFQEPSVSMKSFVAA